MNTLTRYNASPITPRLVLAVSLVLGLATSTFAQADEVAFEFSPAAEVAATAMQYKIRDSYVGGIERRRFADDFKVIGWQTSHNTYFGRTRVAGKYALGFVFSDEKTVYGITYRGFRVTRYF